MSKQEIELVATDIDIAVEIEVIDVNTPFVGTTDSFDGSCINRWCKFEEGIIARTMFVGHRDLD